MYIPNNLLEEFGFLVLVQTAICVVTGVSATVSNIVL